MQWSAQFVRYLLVGAGALLLDVACFVLLRWCGLGLLLSNGGARLFGAVAAYLGNAWFTFAYKHSGLGWHSALRYAALWVGATTLSTAMLELVHDKLYEVFAKIMVEVLVVMLNFVIARTWVFRTK